MNLETGLVEREFSFQGMPESLAITRDGSRLYLGLLVREHSPYWWDGDHEGYVASFDLSTRRKDREFWIAEDPYDLAATSDGRLAVSSGSGQWTYLRVLDGTTGQERGAVRSVYQRSRLTLHPSEDRVYAADTGLYLPSVRRFDLDPGGGVVARWDTVYDEPYPPTSGGVGVSPLGDVVVARGGEVFTSGPTRETDLRNLGELSKGPIGDLAWDVPHATIFTVEGSNVRLYDLSTRQLRGSYALDGSGSFIGVREGDVFVLVPHGETSEIERFSRRPRAVAGADRRVECQGAASATVLLDGSGSEDPDSTPGTHDDIAAFQWFEVAEDGSRVLLGGSETAAVRLGLGSHRVVLRVVDRLGHWGEDEVALVVQDTVVPVLSLSVEPAVLWPPDHRLVNARAVVLAQDACTTASWVLRSVTSDEPDDAPGGGDGATMGDVGGVEIGVSDALFFLRAERSNDGPGRVYTAIYEAQDAAGNTTRAVARVRVPHDQRPGGDARAPRSRPTQAVELEAGTAR